MSDVITNSLLVLILERGLADEQDLEAIQGEHNLSGESVAALLAKDGLVDVPTQLELIAEYLGTDVLDLTGIDFTEDLVNLIPVDMAKQYQCVPIGLDGEVMHLSMVDPLNPTMLDELAFQLNRPLQVRVADSNQILHVLETKYSGEASFDDLIEELGGYNLPDVVEDDGAVTSLEILEEVGDDMPIVRFVNMVLYQSLKDSASDIHFEPFEDSYQIRMKVDGTMKLLTPPPRELAAAISSRLKIMANLNIAERRLPQDGRIATIIAGEELVFRMSTLPTQFGESVVLRLLDKNNTDILQKTDISLNETKVLEFKVAANSFFPFILDDYILIEQQFLQSGEHEVLPYIHIIQDDIPDELFESMGIQNVAIIGENFFKMPIDVIKETLLIQ